MARKKKSRAVPKKGAVVDAPVTPADEADQSAVVAPKKKPKPKKKSKSKKKSTRKKAEKKEETPPDAPSLPVEAVAVDEPEEDAAPVEDLDAVLDEELGGPDDLADLIAQTLAEAEAEPEDFDVEPAVEPLDDDSYIEVLDDPAEDGPTSESSPAATVSAPPAQPAEPAEPTAPETPETPARAASTEQELHGAIDLGPVSTPELRDRLLAQALAHSEMQDARYRVPFSAARQVGRWKGGLAAVLLLVAAVLTVAPPGWVRPEPPAQLSDAGRARGVRAALLLQAQQVDAYRVRFQRLPASLDELSGRLPGIRFVKSGNRAYQLIGYERDGNAIIYDSSNPAPEFARLIPSWTAEEAP